MEIWQLRYFVQVVQSGSVRHAAVEPNLLMESEFAVRLQQRLTISVQPKNAGLTVCHNGQLILRRTGDATKAAQSEGNSGAAPVTLAPSTSSGACNTSLVEMKSRDMYVAVRIVKSLSVTRESLLTLRKIDVASIFGAPRPKWVETSPLLFEQLYLILAETLPAPGDLTGYDIAELLQFPLIHPSSPHGLRSLVDGALSQAGSTTNLPAEFDELATLFRAISSGLGATIQPTAALKRCEHSILHTVQVLKGMLNCNNFVSSFVDGELTPFGLAARLVLREVTIKQVSGGQWSGVTAASLHAQNQKLALHPS